MDSKHFNAVSIITLLVLIPLIAVSGHAYYKGVIPYAEYVAMWREPLLLLFGWWLRDLAKEV